MGGMGRIQSLQLVVCAMFESEFCFRNGDRPPQLSCPCSTLRSLDDGRLHVPEGVRSYRPVSFTPSGALCSPLPATATRFVVLQRSRGGPDRPASGSTFATQSNARIAIADVLAMPDVSFLSFVTLSATLPRRKSRREQRTSTRATISHR